MQSGGAEEDRPKWLPANISMADMWTLHLSTSDTDQQIHSHWELIDGAQNSPSPRVGHSATAIGHRIFVLGGRDFLAQRVCCCPLVGTLC